MPDPQHSLRKLQGDFVISPGTQVVMKVAKALAGGEEYKPAGSVGVVVEAPPSNRAPYQVRFADGVVVKAYFNELSLRRRQFDEAPTPTSALPPPAGGGAWACTFALPTPNLLRCVGPRRRRRTYRRASAP
jgi:hypothetical protein